MTEGGPDRTRAVQHAGPEPTAAGPVPAALVLGLALLIGYAALATLLYRAALSGPFLSDDFIYLVTHPYTAPLSWDNAIAILDPLGPAKFYAANYAPVHLLLTALERHIFAERVLGYHLVNILVHAANAALVAAWLRRAGLAAGVAAGAGLLFLVHPANVEAVAWMSQLKTSGALAFGLLALLLQRRLPLLATLCFALGLLTKASALFALPAAATAVWCARGDRRAWVWVGVWAVVSACYALPQFASFAHIGGVEVTAYDDPWVHARSVVAFGARYLVMAVTGYGVAAWQEPPPALSWLDPYWLAGLVAGLALAARVVVVLRDRRVEAVFWVAAAAAWAPVSQVFPFLIPVADRYLYTILPGLIGGVLFAFGPLRGRLGAGLRAGADAASRAAAVAALLLVAVLVVLFATQTAGRAALWRSETLLLLDAARAYPEGATAYILRARRAAQEGDAEAAIAALRIAVDRGIDRFEAVENDPGLAPIRHDPAFQALLRDMAGRFLDLARGRGYATQPELRMMAIAHLKRDELSEAVAAFEAAVAAGGPLDATVRVELAQARARLAATDGGTSDRTPTP